MKPSMVVLVAAALAAGGCAVHEGDMPVRPPDDLPAAKQSEPLRLLTHEDVGKVLAARLRASEMTIVHHQIAGLEGQSQWHIGGTQWWVRLHGVPAGHFAMDGLDKAKKYRVLGVVLEQNYGVVEVWVNQIGPTD